MIRPSTIASTLFSCSLMAVILAAAPVIVAAADCDQIYTDWKPKRDGSGRIAYFYCQYLFKPAPDRDEMNWVIWYPTKADFKFCYYSNSKGKYWCRAINDVNVANGANGANGNQAQANPQANPRWNVLSTDESKKANLNQIPADAWSGPTHPICPGSDKNGGPGCKMLPPPPPPIARYIELVDAK
ncbi:MAG: hypothetical protein RLY70_3668 [Planctomycetota bacterium]|jgi:hypothetical protein